MTRSNGSNGQGATAGQNGHNVQNGRHQGHDGEHDSASSPWRGLLGLVRQRWIEFRLRRRAIRFRSTDTACVASAYAAMSSTEFDCINAPQEWQNRRVIPRALRALTAPGPWRAIDLGCGSGASTQILAAQLPPASTLIGYDLCPALLERARTRRYHDHDGGAIHAAFVQQSIAQPLGDPAGGPLGDATIDVAHAAGVVGHHLSTADVVAMAAELGRVVRRGGVAILDAGPAMPHDQLEGILRARGFARESCLRAVPGASHRVLVFRRG